jgi:tRNA U34 5-methylaminomethyl-2-thiouridine-forming methyltransferase MnmC
MAAINRELLLTKDGSHTVLTRELNASYHSVHGALAESQHVFIEAGLLYVIKHLNRNEQGSSPLSIFEMGMGTGLNLLLTYIETEKLRQEVYYLTVEKFPLEKQITDQLNYCGLVHRPELQKVFNNIHSSAWNQPYNLSPRFCLHKQSIALEDIPIDQRFNLVYYDAFAPSAQPELWSLSIFQKIYEMLLPRGVLVTYCSKGEVRRNLLASGFLVEKLPGPPGKREIIRAKRP